MSMHHDDLSQDAWDAPAGRSAALAEEIRIDQLRFGLSPRTTATDRDHVAALAAVFTELPPILVQAGSLRVIDGAHRVSAAQLLGRDSIRATLFHGSDVEAAVKAVQCNVAHGKPLTVAERERAVANLLKLHANWSDRRIALVCGVSTRTVVVARARTTIGRPVVARERVGRDGRARPVDAGALRMRVAQAIEADPEASLRAIAQRTGASQATVRDVRARVERGDDVLPPRLRTVADRDAPGDPRAPDRTSSFAEDHAYRSLSDARKLAEWLDSHLVTDEDWTGFVDAVPMGRIYDTIDAARRCTSSWTRFITVMEQRVSTRRRSRG